MHKVKKTKATKKWLENIREKCGAPKVVRPLSRIYIKWTLTDEFFRLNKSFKGNQSRCADSESELRFWGPSAWITIFRIKHRSR